MSTSLYFTVKKDLPLTQKDWLEIEEIISRHQDLEVKSLVEGAGDELLVLEPIQEPSKVVLRGAAQLPKNLYKEDIFDFMMVVEAWFHILSDVRNLLENSVWDAHIDGEPLYWNKETLEFEHPGS